MTILRSIHAMALMTLGATAATLSGSGNITPQDYYGLPEDARESSPPACGMPYAELNLALITAVQDMDTSSTCNLCLNVTNGDESRSIYALAVDLGGAGLDLSIPAFEYLFDQRYDPSPASWSTVANSYCAGIYTPGKTNKKQGVDAGSSTLSPAQSSAINPIISRNTTIATASINIATESNIFSTSEIGKETKTPIYPTTTVVTATAIRTTAAVTKASTATAATAATMSVVSDPTERSSSGPDEGNEKNDDDVEKKKTYRSHHLHHRHKYHPDNHRHRRHIKRSMS